jgi:hypothetical protein
MNKNIIWKLGITLLLVISTSSMVGCSSSPKSGTSNSTTATASTSSSIPDGKAGNPPGAPPSDSSSSSTAAGTAAYTLSGETATKASQNITASNIDESGIKATKNAALTLTDSTITTTGKNTSDDSSNFYGVNAGMLADSGSKITLSNSSIITSGNGANAAFATGAGSVVTLNKVTIKTTADSSRGLDATLTGTVNATDVAISTAGTHSASIATDRGNGTINVIGGTMITTGVDSPGIYSTGKITVSGAKITATGSEAAVVEGKNSIDLTNTIISGAKKRGVMMYQSFSGDAETGTSSFTMKGGSLTVAAGPIFYATNTDAVITLKDATITSSSTTLLAANADSWGTAGSNGATVAFNADNETLTGDITCDSISSITAVLKNGTTLKGSINTKNTAKALALSLDSSSIWNVTGISYITTLTDSDSTMANIHDNGNTIYYNSSLSGNSWLNGKTYTLSGGGKLTPIAK